MFASSRPALAFTVMAALAQAQSADSIRKEIEASYARALEAMGMRSRWLTSMKSIGPAGSGRSIKSSRREKRPNNPGRHSGPGRRP
jgi:hypothetical protein